jgi:hypothetical protein
MSGPLLAEEVKEEDGVKELYTGVVCPKHLMCVATAEQFDLVGLGCRFLTFLQVRTYVVALYCSSRPESKKKLKSVDSTSPSFTENLAATGPLAVRIKTYRATRSSHLRDAFARMLTKNTPNDMSPEDRAKLEEDINAFKRCFPRGDFQVGDSMDIFLDRGRLSVETNGEQQGSIESPALCRILLDCYVGPQAVSPTAKASILEGLSMIRNS